MNESRSLAPVGGILLAMALSIGAMAAAVSLDQAEWIVPPPEKAADGLVEALAAHRYEGALNQLSEDLQQQTTGDDLIRLVDQIEVRHNGIEDSHEQGMQEQTDTATAAVKVKLGDDQEQTIEIPLVKENGLWKVSSLSPLQALAGQ